MYGAAGRDTGPAGRARARDLCLGHGQRISGPGAAPTGKHVLGATDGGFVHQGPPMVTRGLNRIRTRVEYWLYSRRRSGLNRDLSFSEAAARFPDPNDLHA